MPAAWRAHPTEWTFRRACDLLGVHADGEQVAGHPDLGDRDRRHDDEGVDDVVEVGDEERRQHVHQVTAGGDNK